MDISLPKLVVIAVYDSFALPLQRRFLVCLFIAPCPSVSKPNVWHDVEGGWLWTTIPCSDTEQNFLWIVTLLCGFDVDIPVPVIIEDTGIDNLVFPVLLTPSSIFSDEILVWKLSLRVLVEVFHEGMLPECQCLDSVRDLADIRLEYCQGENEPL